ncbi:hypothetical protein DdX_15783 [Ditylenchus destructor]|uniref:Uncharacterized protein n=1 Tax=Ditylenchus destructor TaxID=166010 RepID=A0AAD4MUE8_9BILA|nr:hypothetical protein DdX_15783 [Ditylenchus destructor]
MGSAHVHKDGHFAFGGVALEKDGEVKVFIRHSCDLRPKCDPFFWLVVSTDHICPDDSCVRDTEKTYDAGEIAVDSAFGKSPDQDDCKIVEHWV